MAIKRQEVLSRADFDQAVVHLRLNISEIAKATGVPRTYLSEFRNGDRKLRPENLAKLRDYFEGQGVEFDDAPPVDAVPALQDPLAIAPHSAVAVSTVCHFPVRADLGRAEVRDVLIEMERNDARIFELFTKKARRAWGDGESFEDFSSPVSLRRFIVWLSARDGQ